MTDDGDQMIALADIQSDLMSYDSIGVTNVLDT